MRKRERESRLRTSNKGNKEHDHLGKVRLLEQEREDVSQRDHRRSKEKEEEESSRECIRNTKLIGTPKEEDERESRHITIEKNLVVGVYWKSLTRYMQGLGISQ